MDCSCNYATIVYTTAHYFTKVTKCTATQKIKLMNTKKITVNIKARDGKPSAARASGNIPAVFYGPKEEAVAISVDTREFGIVWKEAGESTIVTLSGIGDDKEALITDMQWHPITDEPMHIDFYVIERGKKVTVNVPLEFIGEAPAEKINGVVTKIMHELEMEVRPSELPQHIDVDLTLLVDISSVITVADLKLPESAEPTAGLGDPVASVSEAVEEDLSTPVGDAMAEGEPSEEGAEEEDSNGDEASSNEDKDDKKEE